MSQSLPQLYAERARFYAAYQRGDISYSQYQQALAYQNQLIASAQSNTTNQSQPQQQQPEPNEPYQPTVPPMYAQDVINPPKTKAEAESRGFYRSVGQPQLAGKYAAPVIPEGYEIVSVQENVAGNAVEVQLRPKSYEVANSFFGPKTSYYDPETGTFREEYITRSGEKIYVTVNPRSAEAVFGPSPREQMASSGLGLATVVATGVAIPVAGAGGIVAVGAGEGVKVGVTGEHLTVEEAIGLAGIGELVAIGGMSINARYVRPRVSNRLTQSYEVHQRLNIESLENYGEPIGVWQPSLTERFLIRVTGAKPSSVAPSTVSMGGPSEIILASGERQVVGGLGFRQLEAVSDAFDLTVAPRTSGFMVSKAAIPVNQVVNPRLLPLYFGLGEGDLINFTDVLRAERANEPPLEEGIPESILDYDYRGPLSFRKTPPSPTAPPQTPSQRNLNTLDLGEGDVARAGFSSSPLTQEQLVRNAEARLGLDIGSRNKPIVSKLVSPPSQTQITIPFTRFVISPRAETRNPFLIFPGVSYYPRYKGVVESEIIVYSYPSSGLNQPPNLSSITDTINIPNISQTPDQGQTPIEIPEQPQLTIQIPDVIPDTSKTPIRVTEPEIPIPPSPNYRIGPSYLPPIPTGFNFQGFPVYGPARRVRLRRKIWEFPVAGPKKLLKELGM